MELSTYRRNVFKTLSVKPAKEGLKYVSKNTKRTTILHAAVGLSTEVGELLEVCTPYLLEGRLTKDQKDLAFAEMGDVGYYVTVLAKVLKVKMPGAGKKLKVVGTRGKALLELSAAAADILSVSKKVFYGTATKEHLKPAGINPMTKEPTKPKTVLKLDAEAQATADILHETAIKAELERVILLFYRLSYDMFQVAPASVFDGNIAKLSHRYGDGFFDKDKALADKNVKVEVATAKAAVKTEKPKKVAKAA